MVISGAVPKWIGFLAGCLQRDLAGFRNAFRPDPLPPGRLFAYRIPLPGGERRIHLRIQPDAGGVLIIDATEVIHLNATAAVLAKMALDGETRHAAVRRLQNRFSHTDSTQLLRDVAAVFDLIDHLSTTPFACPTCGIESLEHIPLFSVQSHAPLKADLALTYGCNNACRHCYNESNRTTMAPLSITQWRRVLDKIARLGIPHVIFTGGEPTLVDGLAELIAHADRIGLATGLNTNGRRLSDPTFAGRLANAGLSHVQITLGSCRAAVHNAMTAAESFDETIAGIRMCLETGLHTITNTTLTRKNVHHAEEIVSFLHTLGLRTIAMNGMIYSGKGRCATDAIPEDRMGPALVGVRDRAGELGMRLLWYTPTAYCRLSPMELDLGPRRCNAAEYSVCIEPNGDVLPCQSYYTAAGNILRDPWNGIWNSPLFRSFRERVDNHEGCGLPEECAHCPDLKFCAGGCRIEREKNLKADTSRLESVCITA